jgi:hypothetical protein
MRCVYLPLRFRAARLETAAEVHSNLEESPWEANTYTFTHCFCKAKFNYPPICTGLGNWLHYVCQIFVLIRISFTGAFRAILGPIRYVPGTRAMLNGRGVKLSSQLRLVPKLKCVELYLPFPVCSYDVLVKDGFTFTPARYIRFQSLVVMAAARTVCNTRSIWLRVSDTHAFSYRPVYKETRTEYFISCSCHLSAWRGSCCKCKCPTSLHLMCCDQWTHTPASQFHTTCSMKRK